MTAASERFDVIVVGGGSAGCVLATRLSEDPDRRILLLEAGSDYSTIEEFPAELSRARSMAATFPGHPQNWSFVGSVTPGRAYPLARGRVIGGSSSVNGTYFIRGRREDFDGWAAAGNDEWSYDKVLPFFRRSESDADFVDEFHGQDGPMPVRRPRSDEMRPVSRAFISACLAAGFPEDPDKNGIGEEGVGPIPRNCVDGYRMNTAVTFLATARDRANLTIRGNTAVTRVLFESKRATGVEARGADGTLLTFEGSEVVLCAGGIKSAHLLLLSGIGPAQHLLEHGIPVVQDSPSVGSRIKDHPSVMVSFQVNEDSEPLPEEFMTFQTCLNHTAPGSSASGDLQITCGAASYGKMLRGVAARGRRTPRLPSYLKRPLATLRALRKLPTGLVFSQAMQQDNLVLLCSLDFEASAGTITLASPDPDASPVVNLNYLSDPSDLPRIAANVRLAVQLLASPEFVRLGVRRVSPSDADLATDEALEAWIRANLGTSLHTSCTAPMGASIAGGAVVDQAGRVHGVTGLRVADISIMPMIVRRGPAATAVMIGERIAEFMKTGT